MAGYRHDPSLPARYFIRLVPLGAKCDEDLSGRSEPEPSGCYKPALTGARPSLSDERGRATPMGHKSWDLVARTLELVSHQSRLQRHLHSPSDCNVQNLFESFDSRPAHSGVHAQVLRDHLACNRVLFCQPHHARRRHKSSEAGQDHSHPVSRVPSPPPRLILA